MGRRLMVWGPGAFICLLIFAMGGTSIFAQQPVTNQTATANAPASVAAAAQGPAVAAQEPEAIPADITVEDEALPTTVTLDFKDADIADVLRIISYKSGTNIVASPEVTGTVNVKLTDVPWEKALDVILKTYGYAYDKQDKVIMVAPLEKLTAQRRMEQDLAQVQPVATEVIILHYIDAADAKKAIETQLSPRGRVTILEVTGQAGWGFGGSFAQKRGRESSATSRSKTLIVSDIPPVMDKIREVLKDIDVRPRQILIETKIVEVSLDKLKDIGFNYATGGAGSASSETLNATIGNSKYSTGGHIFGGLGVSPSAFDPKATGITTANTGLQFVFERLKGEQFEMIFHALEENVASNVLSAPSILTLDNQEATILVGEQFPIVSTTKSSDTSTTIDVSLDEYKDIGIQLNVVPQVSGKDKNYVNMIIHPAVTTEGTLIESKYPRIGTREAQTQVLMKTGETIMIGGLIKDVKNESVQGIPFLRNLPFIGKVFERSTVDTEKIELVIFITAHIIDDRGLDAEQLAALEDDLGLKSLKQ